MQLPDYIIEDPLMKTLKDCVNDFVAFSNVNTSLPKPQRPIADFCSANQDIFSYNVEQSRGNLHNLIAIIMHNDNVGLQTAVDRAGDMCSAALNKYIETRAKLPSYGSEIDAQLAAFLHRLESWISGSLEWSFMTPRYFGEKRNEVKKTRWVKLQSRSRVAANAA
jgi:hypothetical protein